MTRTNIRTLVLSALVLCGLVWAVVPTAWATPNVLVVCYDEDWVPLLDPLVEARESMEYCELDGRPWEYEVSCLNWIRTAYPASHDSLSIKACIGELVAALDGDHLYVHLVGDAHNPYESGQEELDHFPMRYIYAPHIAFWGLHVPSDNWFADLNMDGLIDVIPGRWPAHNASDVQVLVNKSVFQIYNLEWFMMRRPPEQTKQDLCLLPTDASPALRERWDHWAVASDVDSLQLREEMPNGGSYLNYIQLITEDVDREGRSGQLVADHMQVVNDRFEATQDPFWAVSWLHDNHPYDYDLREEEADFVWNLSNQVIFGMSPTANRSNFMNVQDIRYEWDVDHLLPIYEYCLLIAASCDLNDIDMVENYGRPFSERTLILEDRGPIAVFSCTRTMRQWPHYWFSLACTQEIIGGCTPSSPSITIGEVFMNSKNTCQTDWPMHWVEWASIILLGDPCARIVAPPGIPCSVDDPLFEARIDFRVGPNPFTTESQIRFQTTQSGFVSLRVMDVSGRVVNTLVDQVIDPGMHNIRWLGRNDNGNPVGAGMYFTRLKVEGRTINRKILCVR